MPIFINYNGDIVPAEQPIVTAANRGLRYGDGMFETMKVINGEIGLEKDHFDRLFDSLATLKFVLPAAFNAGQLQEYILELAARNEVLPAARVRINCFRKSGGLYEQEDQTPHFVIEALTLPANYLRFNQVGLVVDIYPDARKSCDRFAGIKSNNYLPYFMGALFARDQKLDDALIFNQYDRICDSTISNVFWAVGDKIYTPPLTEGCVSGIMRRNLLRLLPQYGYQVEEKPLAPDELDKADEVFLTNALFGIRWIGTFRERRYGNYLSQKLYSLLA